MIHIDRQMDRQIDKIYPGGQTDKWKIDRQMDKHIDINKQILDRYNTDRQKLDNRYIRSINR